VYRDQDEYARAAPLYEEGLALAQALGKQEAIAGLYNVMGELALLQEDYPRVLEQAQASLALFRALGVQWGIACTLIHQGYAVRRQGNDDLAARSFDEALSVARSIEHTMFVRACLVGFAALAACPGPDASEGAQDAQRAARLLGAVDGAEMVHAHQRECERIITAAHVAFDQTVWEAAWAEGQAMTLEQAIAYALGDGIQESEATE